MGHALEQVQNSRMPKCLAIISKREGGVASRSPQKKKREEHAL